MRNVSITVKMQVTEEFYHNHWPAIKDEAMTKGAGRLDEGVLSVDVSTAEGGELSDELQQINGSWMHD